MKVVTSKEMTRIEKEAFTAGASEESFMLAAGKGVAERVRQIISECCFEERVTILCGKGNNGGDAYVAAAHFLDWGFDVTAYQVFPIENCSKLCQYHHWRFCQIGGKVKALKDADSISFPAVGVILDGLLGTGFNGKTEGLLADVIDKANQSTLPIIAIDIPSGLDGNDGSAEGSAIVSRWTVFLALPKTGFFINKGPLHTGELLSVDFGLEESSVGQAKENFAFIGADDVRPYLPNIKRDRHKYEAGYVVALAGSPGMPGAASISCFSALRGGAGMVRLLHPKGMEAELAIVPSEIVRQGYMEKDVDLVVDTLNKAGSVLIGPGLGRGETVRNMLEKILPALTVPCVIDADGLFLLAEMDKIKLPEETILTPHHGEMYRLVNADKRSPFDNDLLQRCQEYADKRGVVIVVKGATTAILEPNTMPAVMACGDPGMATAGSGDALTGLMAALLSEGLNRSQSAQLAVYLHGRAGKIAAEDETSYCLIATDIIDAFSYAIIELQGHR